MLYFCHIKLNIMKHSVVFFILYLFTTTSFAQTEHATFMGIPINGTITQFHQKIVAKGAKYEKVYSRY